MVNTPVPVIEPVPVPVEEEVADPVPVDVPEAVVVPVFEEPVPEPPAVPEAVLLTPPQPLELKDNTTKAMVTTAEKKIRCL